MILQLLKIIFNFNNYNKKNVKLNRIDGSVFRKCMEIMRPSCKCNLQTKKPKPSKRCF